MSSTRPGAGSIRSAAAGPTAGTSPRATRPAAGGRRRPPRSSGAMGMPGAMSPNPPLLRDADGAAQARHVAAAIAQILERALSERARASLVLSGGSTPLAMYAVL